MSQILIDLASLPIYSLPGICDGAPMIAYGVGSEIRQIIQRLDAGDDLEEVACDFGVPASSLRLLVELREVLAP